MPFVENSQFARWFRNAAPYVRMHRNKVFVVGLPDNCTALDLSVIAEDIQLLQQLGIRIVVVHGSPSTNENSEQRMAQSSLLTQRLMALISANKSDNKNALNTLVVTGNYISAKPKGLIDGVDYGLAGKVLKIDVDSLNKQLQEDSILILSSIGYGKQGDTYDLQFADIVNEIALAVNADKLILYCTQLPETENQTVYSPKSLKSCKQVDAALINIASQACSMGVPRVHLLNVHIPGAILQELFSSSGLGILVTVDTTHSIRGAELSDLNAIDDLIQPLVKKQILVSRSRETIQSLISDFNVVVQDDIVVACAALHSIDNDFNEIACIATHDEHQDAGYASDLVNYLEQITKEQAKNKILVLTTQTTDWFKQRGYKLVDSKQLPSARQSTYNKERMSNVLVKTLG